MMQPCTINISRGDLTTADRSRESSVGVRGCDSSRGGRKYLRGECAPTTLLLIIAGLNFLLCACRAGLPSPGPRMESVFRTAVSTLDSSWEDWLSLMNSDVVARGILRIDGFLSGTGEREMRQAHLDNPELMFSIVPQWDGIFDINLASPKVPRAHYYPYPSEIKALEGKRVLVFLSLRGRVLCHCSEGKMLPIVPDGHEEIAVRSFLEIMSVEALAAGAMIAHDDPRVGETIAGVLAGEVDAYDGLLRLRAIARESDEGRAGVLGALVHSLRDSERDPVIVDSGSIANPDGGFLQVSTLSDLIINGLEQTSYSSHRGRCLAVKRVVLHMLRSGRHGGRSW